MIPVCYFNRGKESLIKIHLDLELRTLRTVSFSPSEGISSILADQIKAKKTAVRYTRSVSRNAIKNIVIGPEGDVFA